MAHASRLGSLGQLIAQDTVVVEEYFSANGLPPPTFDVDGPQDFKIPRSGPVFDAYERVLDNSRELHLLLLGPSKAVRSFAHLDTMVLQAIYRLKIHELIPIHGSASFDEIADATNVDSIVIRRILKFAITNFIFCEDSEHRLRHSSLSRRLAEDPAVRGAVGMLVNESFSGSAQTVESLIRNGNTKDPMQCGWVIANKATSPFYQELNRELPERAEQVAAAMDLLALITPVDQLLNNYGWSELGYATVVDIGGGRGPVSIALANRFPDLRCIVQDLEPLAKSGSQALDRSLADRVRFMSHDFFDEQTVKGADVYFFRYIFHDWPEEQGLRILRALIPALRVGSRVVLNEFAVSEVGTVSNTAHKSQRAIDLNMMVYFNGQERQLWEWKGFIEKVHPRLKFCRAYHPRTTDEEKLNLAMAIIEAVWTS